MVKIDQLKNKTRRQKIIFSNPLSGGLFIYLIRSAQSSDLIFLASSFTFASSSFPRSSPSPITTAARLQAARHSACRIVASPSGETSSSSQLNSFLKDSQTCSEPSNAQESVRQTRITRLPTGFCRKCG